MASRTMLQPFSSPSENEPERRRKGSSTAGRTNDDLPPDVAGLFRSVFMPTYFKIVGASDDPWDVTKIPLSKVQAAFDQIYPDVQHRLTHSNRDGDSVLRVVRQRSIF